MQSCKTSKRSQSPTVQAVADALVEQVKARDGRVPLLDLVQYVAFNLLPPPRRGAVAFELTRKALDVLVDDGRVTVSGRHGSVFVTC